MSEELFPIEESLSPLMAFCRRHGITVFPPTDEGGVFIARSARGEMRGETESAAIFDLAEKFVLEGRKEINWE